MALCEHCRRQISIATRRGVRKAKAAGVHTGRPRTKISEADLQMVRDGELTTGQLAVKLGCSAMTIRRRLRGL
jgi:DNA invertase Pin-like site-specific DNA recombinase